MSGEGHGFVVDATGEQVKLIADETFDLNLLRVLQTYKRIFADKNLWFKLNRSANILERMKLAAKLNEHATVSLAALHLLYASININKALFDYLKAYSSYLRLRIDGKLNDNQLLALLALAGLEGDTRGTWFKQEAFITKKTKTGVTATLSFEWEPLSGKVTKGELIRTLQEHGCFTKAYVPYYTDLQELERKKFIRIGSVPAKTKPREVLYLNEQELMKAFGMSKRLLRIAGRALIEFGLKEGTKGMSAFTSNHVVAYGKGHVSDPLEEAAEFERLISQKRD